MKLKDIVKIKGGKRLPKGSSLQKESNKHPYIRVRDMGEKYISLENLEYVPDDIFPKIQRYIVNENDVIISIVGTIGLISIIDKKLNRASQTENCAKLSGLNSIDAQYIYYYLSSNLGQEEIKKVTVGAVQPKLPIYGIENINIDWKTENERKQIVEILKGLDDKIQLNTETNKTLEQIAQAIFKSWFIDFDPVHAKANALAGGKNQDEANRVAMQVISGKSEAELQTMAENNLDDYAQLLSTAEAFPSGFDNEGLPIGWEVGKLSDIATFPTDRISTKEIKLENYISTENMLENKGGIQSAVKLPSSKTVPRFSKNHILISNIRPYFKKIWLANFSGGRSPDVLSFVSKNDEYTEFLYNLLYQDSFFEFMMTTSKGAKMPRGDKDAIMNMEIVLPTKNLMIKYSKTLKAFYEKIASLRQQNDYLAETRDILLPKLLNREI